MIKAFIYPTLGQNQTLMFEMNSNFEFVTDLDQADIILIHHNIPPAELKEIVKPHHVLVNLSIFNIEHDMSLNWIREYIHEQVMSSVTKKIITLHTNMSINDTHYAIYYDHLFDRQKLYCTDYDRGINLNGRVWTYSCTKEMYSLHPIKKTPFKKFLAPMRIYNIVPNYIHPRMEYRKKIKNFLLEKTYSFVSDNNSSASFLPNAATSEMLPYICEGGSWFPLSYIYYSSSLINVYTETLVLNDKNVRSVTEKSFDPLIQGNFILPFGYSGLIQDILSYGFKLPKWIDYSYDSILDDDERFDAYMQSLEKLNNYSLQQLFDMATADVEILEYNRSIFYSRPYSYPLLADKIKLCIEHNEANNWQY